MSRILHSPLFYLALVSGALVILFGLAWSVNAPAWAIGIIALIIVLVGCAIIVYRYDPDIETDFHFTSEGIDELPGIQDHAEAARKTA